jgi:hypothetical protein
MYGMRHHALFPPRAFVRAAGIRAGIRCARLRSVLQSSRRCCLS